MVWFKSYFQIFCFEILVLRGPYFQRWQKDSSYSGELKMVQVYKKSVFFKCMRRFFFFFFFGGGRGGVCIYNGGSFL